MAPECDSALAVEKRLRADFTLDDMESAIAEIRNYTLMSPMQISTVS